MNKSRILVLQWRDIRNPESGGGERLLHSILKELASLGYDVIKISPRFPSSKAIEVLDGVNIIRIGHKYSVYVLAAIYYLLHLRKRVDLVIEVVTGVPWFTPVYVKRHRLAVVFHLGRKITFFSEFPATAGTLGYFLAAIGWIAERTLPIFYRTTPFVTLSEDTKNDLIQLGLNGKRIAVVQEGVELSLLDPRVPKSSFPHVIYVGRLTRSKGLGFLIQSMKLLNKKVPNARLSIVGRGYLENELREEARRLGIGENVLFHGYVTEDEKTGLLQKAHVLVMPSFREGWATPVLEANACGTPAVGTDVIGVRSTIKDKVTGFLVPYGDTGILADRVATLLTDDQLRNKMSLAAIKWANNFDRKEMVTKFASILEKYCVATR